MSGASGHERSPAARHRRHAPLRRPGGGGPRVARAAARHGACGDRHQRRRQVDADQHPVGRAARQRRAACSCAAPTSRAGRRPRRARAGLGRSYQRTTIYPTFTVLENCRLAAQARHQRPWVWWADASACTVSVPAARDVAARAGLADVLDRARRHAVARPAAPARDRDVPGHRTRGAAARRAAGRHGRRRDRAHAHAAGRTRKPATRSCWSSTTWTRCSASPTASR